MMCRWMYLCLSIYIYVCVCVTHKHKTQIHICTNTTQVEMRKRNAERHQQAYRCVYLFFVILVSHDCRARGRVCHWSVGLDVVD